MVSLQVQFDVFKTHYFQQVNSKKRQQLVIASMGMASCYRFLNNVKMNVLLLVKGRLLNILFVSCNEKLTHTIEFKRDM